MDIKKLHNPPIKVVWEDIPENFTQERIKRARSYFKKKYNTTNVTVVTKAVERKDSDELEIDINQDILNIGYQRRLLKEFIENNEVDIEFNLLERLDDKVNKKMDESEDLETKYKKIYIKNIKFSNFLSFGDNNEVDFTKLGGITVIDSNPPNFGGKCLRKNTTIEIEFDQEEIISKLGYLPDELKGLITLKECYDLFNKYGNLGITVNTPYGFKKINGCDITEKDSEYVTLKTSGGKMIEGSKNHKVKSKNGKFVKIKDSYVGQKIQTIDGVEEIDTLYVSGEREDLYDIEVDEVRQYYSNGIVSHNSVLAVDLILFLFFNTTTKSSKAEEIFNRFRCKDEVIVQGEVEIDGDEYIIIRKVIRKKTKKGDYNVSTNLEFLQKLKDGSFKNFTGEQRRETEKFIKSSIGTMDDFLLTILTTASNLESLVEAKPTERGNTLSRFIGLELLRDKESTCKEMYKEWSKTLISNLYNAQDLKSEIGEQKDEIKLTEGLLKSKDDEIFGITTRIKEKNTNRDLLSSTKVSGIDQEVININPRLLGEEIKGVEKKLLGYVDINKDNSVDKPEEVNEKDLSDTKKMLNEIQTSNTTNKANIINKRNYLDKLKNSEICPMCKRTLEDVDHTEEIKTIGLEIIEEDKVISCEVEKLAELTNHLEKLEAVKTIFDKFEKEELKRERRILEFEQLNHKLTSQKEKLNKWEVNSKAVEENQRIDKELLVLQSDIDILTTSKESCITEKERLKSAINILESKITESKERIEKIKKEEGIGKIFKTYLTTFGKNGIIKSIMKSVVPKLNSELNNLLEDVTEFNLELRVNDKNELQFWMVDKESLISKPLSSGSGFEKTLASLAIRAVLTKVSCLPRPNITVFDEVLGKVSNENLEQVAKFFLRLREYFDNILLITHNPMVREWSDQIITVKKKDNVSTL